MSNDCMKRVRDLETCRETLLGALIGSGSRPFGDESTVLWDTYLWLAPRIAAMRAQAANEG